MTYIVMASRARLVVSESLYSYDLYSYGQGPTPSYPNHYIVMTYIVMGRRARLVVFESLYSYGLCSSYGQEGPTRRIRIII